MASGEYGPELLALMGAALESAWAGVNGRIRDADLARLLMAGAIIERVDEGVRELDDLVSAATQALAAATAFLKERGL